MSIPADLARWLFYFPFRRAMSVLSPGALYRFCRFAGTLQRPVQKKRSRIMAGELKRLFGDDAMPAPVDDIISGSYALSLYQLLGSFQFPKLGPDNIHRWMTLSGRAHLDDALKSGKGVLIILVHFGANQLIMAGLGYRGYTINQLGSRPDDWNRLSGIEPSPMQRKVFRLRLAFEKSLPANFIYIDRSMKPIYDCLKAGEIMLMAVDGRAGKRFVPAQVMRRRMNLSAGPFRIARATGSPILPVFPVCNDEGVFELIIEPPLDISDSLSRTEWIETAAREYGRRLANHLEKHPDHYANLMAEANIRSHIDPTPLFEDYRKK